MVARTWKALRVGGTAAVLLAAGLLSCWALRVQFADTSLAEVQTAIHAQPEWRLFAALGLTVVSFALLAMNDLLGVSVVAPRRVPAWAALLAGAAADGISNTLGFAAVTGSLVRARVYSKFALTAIEVARIVSFTWLTLVLGAAAVLASSELMRARADPHGFSLAIGLSAAIALLLLLAWLAKGERQITVFGFRQSMPSLRLALILVATGAIETAAAFGALYILLPPDLAPPFGRFAVGCIAAVSLGIVAHVPGGLGVFEATVTAMLSGAGRPDLLAALLLYRLIYYLLPFSLSTAALGIFLSVYRDRNSVKKHRS